MPKIKVMLDNVLEVKAPPVARCRLLSAGFKPYHGFQVAEDLTGNKTCLGCGNCIDSCAVLRREPQRRQLTAQRTSLALESVVGEDCEQCFSCTLACPQVDTVIKDYIVNQKVTEVIPQSGLLRQKDYYLGVTVALLLGIFIGMAIMT
ncbi:MAG: 4Fe-4S dicluster domain-containing protein [Thermincolia bacterium]